CIIQRTFDDHASQCNFGLEQVTSSWVLSLDADYELSEEFVTELSGLRPNGATGGYLGRFVYRIPGQALRGSFYPLRIVLYRKGCASYRNEGHTQRVKITGEVLPLNGVVYHDDRKPLTRWLASQQAYALREAKYLLTVGRSSLSRAD